MKLSASMFIKLSTTYVLHENIQQTNAFLFRTFNNISNRIKDVTLLVIDVNLQEMNNSRLGYLERRDTDWFSFV